MRRAISASFTRFRELILEYGIIALVVHYVIFAIVIFGFWFAIRAGWRPSSTAGTAGSWGAAYIAAKITQPLRIVATLAVTPLIARIYERVTGRPRKPLGSSEETLPRG